MQVEYTIKQIILANWLASPCSDSQQRIQRSGFMWQIHRHSASGGTKLICFPVSHANFLVGGGTKPKAKLDWGHDQRSPTGSATGDR